MSSVDEQQQHGQDGGSAATERFVARHGVDALQTVLELVDEFLTQPTNKISMLPEGLAVAPIFGNLLGRSRKQLKSAIEGISDREPVWMILTHNPAAEKVKESFSVRSVVGPCGPIKVSFEDTVGR